MFCPKVPPLTNAGYGIEVKEHQLSKICGIWLIFTNVSLLPRSYIKRSFFSRPIHRSGLTYV